MGKLGHTFVLQQIIDRIKARTYLEIGVKEGYCFRKIKVNHKIGVDPDLLLAIQNSFLSFLANLGNLITGQREETVEFHGITSDRYFALFGKRLEKNGLDVVFVDGLHRAFQVSKDIDNVLKYLNPNGVIVVHDCSPNSSLSTYPANSYEEMRRLKQPGWTGEWYGDVWQALVKLRAERDDLKVFVLDCDCGLGVIVRGLPENKPTVSREQLENLIYHDLENNRQHYLNLKPENYLFEFLKELPAIAS